MQLSRLFRGDSLTRSDWSKMLVDALGEVDHHVLGVFGQLADLLGRGSAEPGEGRHDGLWWDDGAVFNHAAVLQDAATALEQIHQHFKLLSLKEL